MWVPGGERGAELAEWIASSFERLAATYSEIAEETRAPEKTSRMLTHAARLRKRAEHERSEAARFREVVSRAKAGAQATRRD
jgi:hypothetical protein